MPPGKTNMIEFTYLTTEIKAKANISMLCLFIDHNRIKGFIKKFSDTSVVVVMKYSRFVILGGFNMHISKITATKVAKLACLPWTFTDQLQSDPCS